MEFLKIITLVLFANAAFATTIKLSDQNASNIEKPKAESTWEYSLAFGGSVYSGNEEFSLITLDGKASGSFTGHTLSIVPKAEYRQSESEKQRKLEITLNDTIAMEHISTLSNQWGAFVDLKFMKDQNAGIDEKMDSLVGMGYNFFGPYRKAKESLKLSSAFGYRDQKNSDDSNDHYAFNSSRLQWKEQISESFSYKLEIWHTASLKDFENDYESKLLGELENLISKTTSMAFKQESTYDNTPVTGKKAYNSASKVELRFKF